MWIVYTLHVFSILCWDIIHAWMEKLTLVWLDKTITVSKMITTYSVYHSTLDAFITFEIIINIFT